MPAYHNRRQQPNLISKEKPGSYAMLPSIKSVYMTFGNLLSAKGKSMALQRKLGAMTERRRRWRLSMAAIAVDNIAGHYRRMAGWISNIQPVSWWADLPGLNGESGWTIETEL